MPGVTLYLGRMSGGGGGGGHYAWGTSDTGTAANILYLCSHYVVGQR